MQDPNRTDASTDPLEASRERRVVRYLGEQIVLWSALTRCVSAGPVF